MIWCLVKLFINKLESLVIIFVFKKKASTAFW